MEGQFREGRGIYYRKKTWQQRLCWEIGPCNGKNTQNFTDSGLEFNSIYYYRVRAYNSNVQSAHTNTVSVRTILKKSFGDLDSCPLG